MLNVRKEFCVGCGACTRVCPTGAISLDAGTAEIDQAKCTGCYNCFQACPRGAIIAVGTGLKPTPVPSIQELRNSILRLQAEVQIAARRLKSLEQRRKIHRT
jgi:Fe-S-cluster-containing hydrogenase component 2